MSLSTIIIFILILAVLVIVHELGHFLIAKLFRIRVDEFGLGLPPRIAGWKSGETIYSINWLPFGGFVKIFGENPNESKERDPRSFAHKPRPVQVAVLAAGIIFNIVFAWLVISAGYMIGLPTATDNAHTPGLTSIRIIVSETIPQGPADLAGIRSGDSIVSLQAKPIANPNAPADLLTGSDVNPASIQQFVIAHASEPVGVVFMRGAEHFLKMIAPKEGIITDASSTPAIGIAMEYVGIQKLSFFPALGQGAELTWSLAEETVQSVSTFIGQAVTGHAHLSDVSGPVGIASVVGDAQQLGFIYLLSLTAFISINLAVLNLIPFPALDGGRILFVAIEAIIRRPIKAKIVNAVNSIGFGLLILLMIVVTFKDVMKLF